MRKPLSPGGCVDPIPGEMRKPNPQKDAETPSSGMLQKLGDLPQVCPRPKKFERHATRDTPHGSRPNLPQRDPKHRIVPSPPNVWIKVRARRDVSEKRKTGTIIRIRRRILTASVFFFLMLYQVLYTWYCIRKKKKRGQLCVYVY